MWWLLCFALVIGCFGFVLLFGAPYVPTLRKQQLDALALLHLQPGQTLIELGSGDGRMLRAAAQQGLYVVGYELNPLLVVISYLVCFAYRDKIRIHWGNFWHQNLPPTDGIYVFLLEKYMYDLDKKVAQQFAGKKVKLVSYAFKIPNKKPVKVQDALYLYQY